MHKHQKNNIIKGKPIGEGKKVMIMVHGRGATAESILSLADYLRVEDFTLIAPQATANTWYPYSFMAPVSENEPGLTTGLHVLKQTVDEVKAAGIAAEDIYFLGFSQGACLTSEFVARNAEVYGGVFILSGGVIGARVERDNYKGNFAGTPIFLGVSDIDAHVPLSRANETVKILEEMGAKVKQTVYPNAPHTVLEDEIDEVNHILS